MNKGFTLIEVMVSIAILAILSSLFISTNAWFERIETRIAMQTIQADLLLAQKSAFDEYEWVSICPSKNGHTCDATWGSSYMVFYRETKKPIWHRILNKNIQIIYQGFPSNTQIDYQPSNEQISNGTLIIAYRSRSYYRLIFNQAGRIRIESVQ